MRKHAVLMLLVSAFETCTSADVVSVQVCRELGADQRCIGDSQQFEIDTTVYVVFESPRAFKASHGVVKLYVLERGRRLLLGRSTFAFDKGDSLATDTLILGTPGQFVVTFESPPGNELARQIIQITPPS